MGDTGGAGSGSGGDSGTGPGRLGHIFASVRWWWRYWRWYR